MEFRLQDHYPLTVPIEHRGVKARIEVTVSKRADFGLGLWLPDGDDSWVRAISRHEVKAKDVPAALQELSDEFHDFIEVAHALALPEEVEEDVEEEEEGEPDLDAFNLDKALESLSKVGYPSE